MVPSALEPSGSVAVPLSVAVSLIGSPGSTGPAVASVVIAGCAGVTVKHSFVPSSPAGS